VQVTDARRLRQLIVSPHEGISDRLLEIIRQTGTLLEGHFELDAARHAPYFIRFSQIGWKHGLVDEVAGFLLGAASFAAAPATIVCAETSSIFLARALGRKTGNPVAVAAADANRQPTGTLRTGKIAPDRPILVVSDVITTGRSLLPLLSFKSSPKDILGIVSFAVLAAPRFERFARAHHLPSAWMIAATWQIHPPSERECPGCAAGIPILPASEFS
jgi:orotate phosphoribosyltransferase